jgi:hypothetical protein
MLQNLVKVKSLEKPRKKENQPIPYKGATLVPYSQVSERLPHLCSPPSRRRQPDFVSSRRVTVRAVYRIGVPVNQDYRSVYR